MNKKKKLINKQEKKNLLDKIIFFLLKRFHWAQFRIQMWQFKRELDKIPVNHRIILPKDIVIISLQQNNTEITISLLKCLINKGKEGKNDRRTRQLNIHRKQTIHELRNRSSNAIHNQRSKRSNSESQGKIHKQSSRRIRSKP